MQLTYSMLLIVCPLALLAGFVDSVAGGGGLISLPAYYLAGLSPTLAAGTNKLSAALGTLAASIRYQRSGKIQFTAALPAALMALPGSYLGTQVLLLIPERVIRIMMLVALPLVAVVVLRKKGAFEAVYKATGKRLMLICAGIGFLVGFYDGLVGPGTGTFLILGFTFFAGMEAVTASGSAKIVNLASNIASLLTLLMHGQVMFSLGLSAAIFTVIGNTLGAGMTVKKGTGFVRVMMLAVLVMLLAKMAFDVVT